MSRRTPTPRADTPSALAAGWAGRAPQRALKLARGGRMLLAGLFGVATTLAFMPLVDGVYLTHLMAWEMPVLPSLVSAGIGMAVYIMGWRLLVGTVGECPVLRRATVVYFWLGVLMCVLVLALIVYGLALNAQAA